MNLRRIGLVAGRDLAHNARRPVFFIWIALLFLITWGMSAGTVRVDSGDSAVGGVKAYVTSEFAVARMMTILVSAIYGFFISVVAGMAVIQDDEARIGEILNATPLTSSEYILGKFLAVLLSITAVLAAHVGMMIYFNHGVPAGEAAAFIGPFLIGNYLRPALMMALPTMVFFAGASFFVGERTRRPILVFFGPVAILLGCLFFVWDWAPSWIDPRVDRLLMLIDPACYRWLNETLLKVDRGVAFYNVEHIPIDATFLANRLIFLTIGLGGVLMSVNHYTASVRGVSRRAERAWKSGKLARVRPVVEVVPRPLGALGMTSRRPGLLRGAWTVMWAEVAELRSSPGLYLFVPLLVLEALGPNLLALGAFETPLLLTSGTFAVRTLNPLTTMICLLLMFTTVESLWREHQTRLASISMATPIRTGSILIGKAMANSMVGMAVLGLELLAGVGMLLYQKKVPIEAAPFALVWGLLLLPTVLVWTSFVMATLSITRSRYVTYGVALSVLIFTGFRQVIGKINWLGNWPLWSAVQWSDISVLEFDRTAIVLNRLLVLGMALLFIVLTTRFFARRDLDAVGLAKRLRFGSMVRSNLWMLPVAALPIVVGFTLWAKVDAGFQGDGPKKLMKDYWRKNIATYKDWPLPDLTAVDVSVDLEPATGRLKVSGTYDLINNQAGPIDQIPMTGGLHWEKPTWTLDGKDFVPENRSGLFLFRPGPIPPGGKVRIGYKFEGTFPGGISRNGGGSMEFIVPSGVVLTNFGSSFAPALGFQEGPGVDEENSSESKEYPDDYYVGQTESFAGSRRPYRTRVVISGPPEFTYNSVGTQTSEVVASGRKTTVWESDKPVNFFNIVAGKWDVRRGKDTAVYYHPKHKYNVEEMVGALDAARTYYSEWFHPYPWKELKLSEFPALAGYAQGFATDITFSESIGFLTESDPDSSAAFLVTAHESAHQWWGNIVAPGKGPGGNLLSEGTSHFSTLLLFEQVKGLRGRIEFARRIEDSYAKGRSPDSERSMVKTDGTKKGDNVVTYDKSGWAFWMLMNQMGRDRMLAGIREFFERYHENPDHPVIQDFLAVLRGHASDTTAFDAFVDQWFYKVVMPDYKLTEAKKTRDGDKWTATVKLTNGGTGTMAVEVAATLGERFEKKETAPSPTYREARKSVVLSAGESAEVVIPCDFEPKNLVVDPDAKVLMLHRKTAIAPL